VAVKTCADIERPYMSYLSDLLDGKEIVPVGPLLVDDSDRVTRWLDAQPPASVVLVSFGSEYFMSEQQLARMARGLELSGERFPKGPEDEDNAARSLPRGFAPAPGRGLVVEGWAPRPGAPGLRRVPVPLRVELRAGVAGGGRADRGAAAAH
jgi:hypothetical protein